MNGQHAIRHRRLDVAVPTVARQRDAKLELADSSGPAAEQTLALALLHLAGYHQLVAVQLDVDVLASHTRKLDFDDISAVGLDDIGRRQPGTLTGEATEYRLRQPIHLRIEILELAKRAPLRLTSRTFHGQSHVSSSSNSSAVVVKDCPKSGRAPRAGETISCPRFHSPGSVTISGDGRHQNTSRNSVNARFQWSVDGFDTVGAITRNDRASAILNPPNKSGRSSSVSSANVTSPGGCRTTWRSNSRISSASSSLSNSRIRSWMPLVTGRPCATITSRPFHLAELRPAMAISSICSSTNSRKRRTSFLSILILATERKNRSNTGIPDGWVTRLPPVVDPGWPDQADT